MKTMVKSYFFNVMNFRKGKSFNAKEEWQFSDNMV
jgi:hypothetical protein